MNQQAQNDRIYLIGNPTRDRIVRGGETIITLGGTVLYAGLFFARAGIPVFIVGKGDEQMLAWIESCGIGSDYVTLTKRVVAFENRYGPAGRQQLARSGKKIALAEIPKSVFQARAILVGAVLMEVDPGVARMPRSGLLMLDVQGFLRNLGAGGKVILRPNPPLEEAIGGCDILKADEHEAEAITGTADICESARRLHRMGPRIVIITLSSRGSGIFDGSRWIRFRAPKLPAVDPTGAGDVFDAAFLAEYLRTGDVIAAGCFGTAAATLSVAGFGTNAVPTGEKVRLAVRDHFHAKPMVTVNRLPG